MRWERRRAWLGREAGRPWCNRCRAGPRFDRVALGRRAGMGVRRCAVRRSALPRRRVALGGRRRRRSPAAPTASRTSRRRTSRARLRLRLRVRRGQHPQSIADYVDERPASRFFGPDARSPAEGYPTLNADPSTSGSSTAASSRARFRPGRAAVGPVPRSERPSPLCPWATTSTSRRPGREHPGPALRFYAEWVRLITGRSTSTGASTRASALYASSGVAISGITNAQPPAPARLGAAAFEGDRAAAAQITPGRAK